MVLLLLLLCVGATLPRRSLEQQGPPPSRCDELQTLSHQTACTSCAASSTVLCPRGFSKTTTGIGTANCSYVVEIGGQVMELGGCSHTCKKNVLQPRCCPEHWGPLCLRCPSWLGKTCNYHGTCMDGDLGNGTCICDEGFTGFTCQACANPNAYGPDCSKECDCVNGMCNNGPEGTGECYCQPPYTGPRCDQVSAGCKNCTTYSYCKESGDNTVCECLPGHRKTKKNTCASLCSTRDCHVRADCTVSGGKVKCACQKGYEGDGRICVPINLCFINNGDCPLNSTVCVFKGPNKSGCECMVGMAPVNGNASFGCQLVSACSLDTCDSTAVCQTGLDGQARCVCEAGQIGDGRRCYGNLLQRVVELDRAGAQTGKLSGAITLFEKGCQLSLTHNGPFTAFIPLLKNPLSGVNEELLCKNHLVLGQHLYQDLEGMDFNMVGGARARGKGNKQFILMDDPSRLYTVIQEDIPAANGIIHIIDQPITNTLPDSPRDEQFSDKTIGEILTKDGKYNRFLSLADNCGAPLPLRGPGPLTVFVPTNQAVDRARDGSIIYMLNDAKHKLQELLKHHMYSQAALTVDQLASMTQIQTMANQIIKITVAADGKILLGDKNSPLESTNIIASNGIIHMVDGLLVPPSITPILPHRCDVIESKITVGPCERCSYLYETQCPDGSTELDSHMNGCDYIISPIDPTPRKGCAKYCNVTKQIAECCKGFYGPDCKPCIGGFQNPCYDKGTCFDGIHGNGSCSCQSGFKGVACHICSDLAKHGENCDQECHCVHGVCDNRPGSRGLCRRGSCKEGYSGDLCDHTATPCNSDGLHEHCHIHAYCSYAGLRTTCACRAGYEGDGHSCSPVNPCLRSSRGGCDTNAQCVYIAAGNASCVCNEGWSGDGKVCVEIDNCQLETRGGCSSNADCNYIGPAQSDCTCKSGYMGDGILCDLINPCITNNGGCHSMATCTSEGDGLRNCTCPQGYGGDGVTCYGDMLEELDINHHSFYRLAQLYKGTQLLDLSGNITALVPSKVIFRNLGPENQNIWTRRHGLPYLLKAHFLQGVYAIEDLERLVGSSLPTLNSPTQWLISNTSGGIHIGNASIITPNLPTLNGYIHVIDTVLIPPISDLPPEPPTLMEFLNSTTTFSLFRQHALLYNLSAELGVWGYTILMPTDDAIKQYLSETNSTHLEADVFKYHVIRYHVLFPDGLKDGTLKATMLGSEYQIQFHLNKDNQTAVDEVVIDGSHIETQLGVIIPLTRVLRVHRNRCGREVTLLVSGRCTDCNGPPKCFQGHKPVRSSFPPDMPSTCKYRKRDGPRRRSVPGCIISCLQTTKEHTCCPGYYGHECFKCPGEVGSWCSNHGTCQDGSQGNGECRCYEGFHGIACEDCEPGRYGTNCSSNCSCAQGKCLDGLRGSGGCLCYKGWKGERCSVEIKDDACGGICDENANCVNEPMGATPACVCVAGYEGNGTSCKEVDECGRSNGGCSEFANCTKISAGERSCTCREGYNGDGVVCLEIDGCLVNNGGCHRFAECTRTGPNTTACTCRPSFTGSGRFCYPFNPCRVDNGGCGRYAMCRYLGDGQTNCSCYSGHVRDGDDCRANTRIEVLRRPEATFFRSMMSGTESRSLLDNGPITMFVPLYDTNANFSVMSWKLASRQPDLVRYHSVVCEVLRLADLKTTSKAIASSGHTLLFTSREGTVYINNVSRIVTSDWTTADGVIHYIDKVLTPYQLEGKPDLSNKMNFTTAAEVYGYSKFSKLVQDAGLLPLLQMSLHQPFTMFWPTDEALNSLPAERQRWINSPDHRDKLAATVKAHIIRSFRLQTLSQRGVARFRTMHGSIISLSCDSSVVGGLLLNGNNAKVVDRFLRFDVGMAYGIDQLLEPPGLGAHCDGMENQTINGRCGSCANPPKCRYSATDTGKKERCPRFVSDWNRYHGLYDQGLFNQGLYNHGLYSPSHHRFNMGCKRVCQSKAWVPQCCKNHYGRDCEVCAGGVEAPCGDHGDCDDGRIGSGRCRCHPGFKGAACEQCQPGYYGSNCTACACAENGSCEDGIDGSGTCVCQAGWYGDKCQLKIGEVPKECKDCHADAVCIPSIGCQCKPQYEGNGTYCAEMTRGEHFLVYVGKRTACGSASLVQCTIRSQHCNKHDQEIKTAADLCAEYNGGCHQNADCNQTGFVVNCTCQTGYHGDGFSCDPINRCVEENNGGCSDFATCKFTGPNERQCECQQGYVGNGVQCMEKVVPPVNRCLEDNGGCDPKASCKDLHFHTKTAGVFHLRSPDGKYEMNFNEAAAACQAEGATLATFKQLADAQQLGMHLCVAGWIDGGKVGYPIRFPSVKCGENHVGVVLYKNPVNTSSKYDAYCYRLKEVSCVCGSGYVGDGDFCNGDLASVVATYSNFSVFYKMLLKYADSSVEGKTLLSFLSTKSSYATLFVPHNAGFSINETLSGRDVEYHISANNSKHLYDDLKHKGAITSRLGLNLSVAVNTVNSTLTQASETYKLVNQRVLLAWDIPASNGLIHVIEGPLRAPPPPTSHHASRGHAHSSGTASAILVTLLLVCLLAGLGYYVFKHKNDAFRFQYFRNEDEDGASRDGAKPALVSIPNPLYSGYRAFAEPFGDSGPVAEPAEPMEPVDPPKILDLD